MLSRVREFVYGSGIRWAMCQNPVVNRSLHGILLAQVKTTVFPVMVGNNIPFGCYDNEILAASLERLKSSYRATLDFSRELISYFSRPYLSSVGMTSQKWVNPREAIFYLLQFTQAAHLFFRMIGYLL